MLATLVKTPKSVKYCGKCTFRFRHKTDGRISFRRFRCRSWRHEGSQCQKEKNKADFARIVESLKGKDGLVYLVLTLPGGAARPKDARELYGSYRTLYDKWDKLRKRLARRVGKFGYLCVVEAHKDGVPHLNIIVDSTVLYKMCAMEYSYADAKGQLALAGYGDGEISRIVAGWEKEDKDCVAGWRVVRQTWLREACTQVGFGGVVWVEPVREETAISYYLLKLVGEVAKLNQVPIMAPARFRRLRASRGFLKVFEKPKSDWEGELLSALIETYWEEFNSNGSDIIEITEEDRDGVEMSLEKFVVAPPGYQGARPIQDSIIALIQAESEGLFDSAKSVPIAPGASNGQKRASCRQGCCSTKVVHCGQ